MPQIFRYIVCVPTVLIALTAVGCSSIHDPDSGVLRASAESFTAADTQALAISESNGKFFSYYENRPVVEPDELQTGRYSSVVTGPEIQQINPLLTVIDVRLPRDINTVEDAAGYLLARSGYCLMEAQPGEAEVTNLFRQTLPDVHRHLGPMTLRDALLTLGGRAFRVVVDEVYREVGFQLSPTFVGGIKS